MNINGINSNYLTSDKINNNTTLDNTSKFSEQLDNAYTFKEIFEEASQKYNVSVDLLQAVAMTESSFNPDCVSHAGAMGLMQLMPKTAEYLGVTNAFDPYENVMGGAKYLSELLDKYNGDTNLALAAYNGGMGNVAKYDGIPPFCEDYIKKVNSYLEQQVTAPDKIVILNPSENSPIVADSNIDNVSEDGASQIMTSEEFAQLVYNLFSQESSKTAVEQLDLLKSMLKDSIEYEKAITLFDSIYADNKDKK